MKLIIAGGRDITLDTDFIGDLINRSGLPDQFEVDNTSQLEIVSGGAAGIDTSGERFGFEYGSKVTKFPADWDKLARGAGPVRNKLMADYADALLLIWNGESKGSANMRDTMVKQGKPIYEVIIRRVQ